MQKKLFSLLGIIVLAVTILMIPAEAFAIVPKGAVLISPTPTPILKKAPDFTLSPTPTPTMQILEGVKLATPTPTPNFKKIPDTEIATPTPEVKILEGVTRVSPTPAADTKQPAPSKASSSLPEITKHPSGEIVDAGRGCSFVAYANNYDSISWYFKNGETKIDAADAAAHFSGLTVTDTDATKVRLRNVPGSLNGWEVGAVFTNSAGSVNTNTCVITVIGGDAATPAPTAAPAPEAAAVPETPAPAETPEPGTVEALVSDPDPAAEDEPAVTMAPAPAPTKAPEKEKSGSILPVILGIIVVAAIACAAFFVFTKKGSGSSVRYKGKH